MWREFIENMTSTDSKCTFTDGATLTQIEAIENVLKSKLPYSLTSLLQESNGVDWRITFLAGDEFVLPLIWSTERIIEENLHFRDLSNSGVLAPFESLLFFGSEGNGNQFAFGVTSGRTPTEDIFVWSHEDDSREKISSSLREHLEALKRYTAI